MPESDRYAEVPCCGSCGSVRWQPFGYAQGFALRRCTDCGTPRFATVVRPDFIYDDGYHDGSSTFGWDWTTEETQAYELAVNDRRVAWLERHASRGRLADVGGGLGFFAAAAARRGWDATLVEPVGPATEFAREVLLVKAIQAGVESLASGAEPYDVVALLHVLEHFPNPREVLDTIRPGLSKDGHLLIEVPNLASLARRLQGQDWMGWQAGEHIHFFNRRTLTSLVERAGYRVDVVDTFVPGWPGLLPEGYAHFLGVEKMMHAAVGVRRRLANRGSRTGDRTGRSRGSAAPPPPIHENIAIAEMRGLRGPLYRKGFDTLAAAEERLHLGTNVRLLARLA